MEHITLAKETIKNNGRCLNPKQCNACLYYILKGTVKGCNPVSIIELANNHLQSYGGNYVKN